MNPFTMFILAILSPFLIAATLLVPPYLGIVGASYIIYYKAADKVHPLSGKLYDVFYMIDVYANLFKQWAKHIALTDILTYSLPLLALPIFTTLLALWMTAKLAAKLKDIFQLGASY